MNFNNRNIKLKAKTWIRDSYGLYDYETKNYFSHSLIINTPGKIIRNNNEIIFVPSGTQNKSGNVNEDQNEILATIGEISGEIAINADPAIKEEIDKLWQVVYKGADEGEKKGYQLKVGDVIKLGRIMFRVKQIKLEDKEKKTRPVINDRSMILSENTWVQNSITHSLILKAIKLGKAQCHPYVESALVRIMKKTIP